MLSVCIVNWNTKTYLRDCLASLRSFPPTGEKLEVIVVDNASSDHSAEMVAEEFPDVILLAQTDNLGYAEANNVALRRTTGDSLLLLNPDVVVNKSTLTNSLSFLHSHPKAGAVSVLFRNPDGTIQPSLRSFPHPAALLWEVTGMRRSMPKSKTFGAYFNSWFQYDRPIQTDQPMGTFLLIPRAAYVEVGELDTQFPIFFNEVDWCYRAKQAGWEIWFTPDAEIIHYGGQGTKQAPKAKMVKESHASLIRFYEKHYRAKINSVVYLAITSLIQLSCTLRLLTAAK